MTCFCSMSIAFHSPSLSRSSGELSSSHWVWNQRDGSKNYRIDHGKTPKGKHSPPKSKILQAAGLSSAARQSKIASWRCFAKFFRLLV